MKLPDGQCCIRTVRFTSADAAIRRNVNKLTRQRATTLACSVIGEVTGYGLILLSDSSFARITVSQTDRASDDPAWPPVWRLERNWIGDGLVLPFDGFREVTSFCLHSSQRVQESVRERRQAGM